MKNKLLQTFLSVSLLTAISCSHQVMREPSSEVSIQRTDFREMVNYPQLNLKLRAGYSLESGTLKACVLYLQGLGDSIQNHKPYFSRLNDAGYRVITFDYMGQGASEGSMNDTRIKVELPLNATKEMKARYESRGKYYEIPVQGEFIWKRYQNIKNSQGQDCSKSPRIVIGWSTGGLAAYRMAYEKRADIIILIAPGIHPKLMVGESAQRWDKMLMFRETITERTLTRNKFEGELNPHVDAVKPKSPAHVLQFGGNLIGVAAHSRRWKIDQNIPGMVFLSGSNDTYVERNGTYQTLRKNAPHFTIKSYDGALHELDNELDEVANDLYERSVSFLDSVIR